LLSLNEEIAIKKTQITELRNMGKALCEMRGKWECYVKGKGEAGKHYECKYYEMCLVCLLEEDYS
jgi:hypothetical protein